MRDRVLGHLARIGGVIVRPRATLLRMFLGSEGSLLELIPWMVIISMTVAPVSAGRALLSMRVDPVDGFSALLRLLAGRMVEPLACAFGGAAVLYLFARVKRPFRRDLPFDRALDLAAFMLVPYFALAAIGVIAASAGVDLWWLPHRQLNVPIEHLALKALVSYGWSLALLLILTVMLARGSRGEPAGSTP